MEDEDDTIGAAEYLKQEDFPIVTKKMRDFYDDINPEQQKNLRKTKYSFLKNIKKRINKNGKQIK